jgi:hypothetical protein
VLAVVDDDVCDVFRLFVEINRWLLMRDDQSRSATNKVGLMGDG